MSKLPLIHVIIFFPNLKANDELRRAMTKFYTNIKLYSKVRIVKLVEILSILPIFDKFAKQVIFERIYLTEFNTLW